MCHFYWLGLGSLGPVQGEGVGTVSAEKLLLFTCGVRLPWLIVPLKWVEQGVYGDIIIIYTQSDILSDLRGL